MNQDDVINYLIINKIILLITVITMYTKKRLKKVRTYVNTHR